MTSRVNDNSSSPTGSRPATMAPRVSVVLVADTSVEAFLADLLVLAPACRNISVELVAVAALGRKELVHLESAWPSVIFSEMPASASVVEMREAGLAGASGDVVLIKQVSAGRDDRWMANLRQIARVEDDAEGEAGRQLVAKAAAEGRGVVRRPRDVPPLRDRRTEPAAADSGQDSPARTRSR